MRTLLMSDLHIGFKYSRASDVLHVLENEKYDRIVLVGDIFDMQQMMKRPYWDEHHTAVLKKILKLAKTKEVVYVIGNHDYPLFYLQEYTDKIAKINITREHTYVSGGQTFLCMHGDQLEDFGKGWQTFGDMLYYGALKFNKYLNKVRRTFGLPYWSFSKWCKDKAKNRIASVFNMEAKLWGALKDASADQLIYGHTHMPYAGRDECFSNCGSFVEIATYLIEEDGVVTLHEI